MSLDEYFQRTAADAAYRAQEICNTEYMAKFCVWWGGVFFVLWFGLGAFAYSAGEGWTSSHFFFPVVLAVCSYGHLRTKAAALRALDRQNPPT